MDRGYGIRGGKAVACVDVQGRNSSGRLGDEVRDADKLHLHHRQGRSA